MGRGDSGQEAGAAGLLEMERPELGDAEVTGETLSVPARPETRLSKEDYKLKLEDDDKFVKSKLQELNEAVAALVRDPAKLKELLDTHSGFHNYSHNNVLWLLHQNPRATRCASFKNWKEKHGRQVKKGEKALTVAIRQAKKLRKPAKAFNPATGQEEQLYIWKVGAKWQSGFANHPGKPADAKLKFDDVLFPDPTTGEMKPRFVTKGYAAKPVTFDISQTEPIEGAEVTPDENAEKAFSDLKAVCEKRGFTVKIGGAEDTDYKDNFSLLANAGLKGYLRPKTQEIVIRDDADAAEKTAVLAHELAHADMGHGTYESDEDRQIKEAQAESAAYTICAHYGIKRDLAASTYIAHWAKDNADAVHGVLDSVHKSFRSIMSDVYPQDDYSAREPYKRKASRARKPARKKK